MSVSDSQTTPDLVPDVILYILENFGFLRDVQTCLGFRLISKTWDNTLKHIVQKRTVCYVSDENITSFLRFLQSETSLESQMSNIRSVVFNILQRIGMVIDSKPIRADEEIYTQAMTEFTQLPTFFLAQLLSFRLNFEFYRPPSFEQVWKFLQTSQLTSLEELQIDVSSGHDIPVFPLVPGIVEAIGNISFSRVRRLEVPLQVSLHFFKGCSDQTLTHLTLNVFGTELSYDFWETFKTELIRQKESMTEIFLVNKNIRFGGTIKVIFSYLHLLHANLRLKNLGLGLPISFDNAREEKEILVQFLNQQSSTLEYLQLPGQNLFLSRLGHDDKFISRLLDFPKLVELRFGEFSVTSGQLLAKCPRLENIGLPSRTVFPESQEHIESSKSLTVRSVSIRGLDRSSTTLFQIFPNMEKLKLKEQIKHVSTLNNVLTKGTELKELSIQVQFNILDERALKRHGEDGFRFQCYDEDEDERQRKHERPIKADCFILGQKPRHCKPYQSGKTICNATTEFPLPSAPSLANFHCLEHLCLEGYFTELTLWAGIKRLTTLKEFRLKSQYLIHPSNFLELESYLPQLKSWSFTKLEEEKYGYRDMYKFFRRLPNMLGPNQIHIWKFNDWYKVDKKVVTIEEFEGLDLSYNGTQSSMVPDGFYAEPDSESDLDTELSNSDLEYAWSSGEETGSEAEEEAG